MMESMTAGKVALVRLFGRKACEENRQENKEEIKRGKQRERKKKKTGVSINIKLMQGSSYY